MILIVILISLCLHYHLLCSFKTYSRSLSLHFLFTFLFTYRIPAPTLAFVSAYIQIRIDGWRLCQAHRRPQPKTAEDMGEFIQRKFFTFFLHFILSLLTLFYTVTLPCLALLYFAISQFASLYFSLLHFTMT